MKKIDKTTRKYLKTLGVPLYKRFYHFHEPHHLQHHLKEVALYQSDVKNGEEGYQRALARHIYCSHKFNPIRLDWIILFVLALIILFVPKSHCQVTNDNLYKVGGVIVDPTTYDTTNKAIKVNCVNCPSFSPTGTQDTNIKQINGATISLGQKTMVNSYPIVIASDQGAIPVSGTVAISGTVAVTESGTWNVNANASQTGTWNIGTLTTLTTLTSITNPVAVTGAFFQAIQPISVASLPLPSGASTEATLALIKAKTDNLDVLLSSRTKPADAQHTILDSGSISNTGFNVNNFPVTQPVSIATAPTTPVTQSTSPWITQLVNNPPQLTQQQLSNPLLYRTAMQNYCKLNLCPGVK